MKKKEIKKIVLNDRLGTSISKNVILNKVNETKDKDLKIYEKLKNELRFNLEDDIDNKIQRMKIIYEIKTKELYRYDGFTRFDQFIKSFVIAKSQVYLYLKVYEKVLNGVISIDTIKEIGFKNIYKNIKKQSLLDITDSKSEYEESNNEHNTPIRILIKNKELYKFAKANNRRIGFMLESLYKNNKEVFLTLASEYEKYRKEKKYKKRK